MKGCDIIKHIGRIIICFLLLTSLNITGWAYGSYEQNVSIDSFPSAYKQYAYTKCAENNLSYEMFLAVAFNESRFTVDAVNVNKNGTTDRGLCQINDSCFSFLKSKGVINNKNQLFDPYTNIDCYIELMKYHIAFTGDEDLALLRYQVGEGRYNQIITQDIDNDTYQRVLAYKKDFEKYLYANPIEILELYTLNNYPYLCEDFPEFKTVLTERFNSMEWTGRYR